MVDDPDVEATKSASEVKGPRIGRFIPEDGDEMFFLFLEDFVLCQVNSFERAIFVWFSLFYIFHLSYPPNIFDVCLFLQEFVFGIPEPCGLKSSTYRSVSTDIQNITFNY